MADVKIFKWPTIFSCIQTFCKLPERNFIKYGPNKIRSEPIFEEICSVPEKTQRNFDHDKKHCAKKWLWVSNHVILRKSTKLILLPVLPFLILMSKKNFLNVFMFFLSNTLKLSHLPVEFSSLIVLRFIYQKFSIQVKNDIF